MKQDSSDFPDGFELPPYPYVPGRGPKYSDTDYSFRAFHASVTPDLCHETLGQTLAFRAGRAFFDAGFYWECYHVLDPVWMQTKDPSPERDMLLAFIQLANARLKLRSGSPAAAWRLCDMVEAHLSRCPTDKDILGMQVSDLMDETEATRKLAKSRM